MAKRYRVAFRLDGRAEASFETVPNKPEFLAQMIQFYFGFCSPLETRLDAMDSRLAAIEAHLSGAPTAESPARPGQEEEVDKKIDSLINKTLGYEEA